MKEFAVKNCASLTNIKKLYCQTGDFPLFTFASESLPGDISPRPQVGKRKFFKDFIYLLAISVVGMKGPLLFLVSAELLEVTHKQKLHFPRELLRLSSGSHSHLLSMHHSSAQAQATARHHHPQLSPGLVPELISKTV